MVKGALAPSKTASALKQTDEIPVLEDNTSMSPKIKNTFIILPKEKEPQLQVVQLKKVPAKPTEREKQGLAHRVEVERTTDRELTAQELHKLEDGAIMTFERPERVFTAVQEARQLCHLKSTETLEVLHKNAEGGLKKTLQQKQKKKTEVPRVNTQKLTLPPAADKQKESVKPNTFEIEKPEQDKHQTLQQHQVHTKPQELDKNVLGQQAEVTKEAEAKLIASELQDRQDHERITLETTSRVLPSAVGSAELGFVKIAEQLEVSEKFKWTRSYKVQQERELKANGKNMVNTVPKKSEEQEAVRLKAFINSQKQETNKLTKSKQEVQLKTDYECSSFKTGLSPILRQASVAIEKTENSDALGTSPDKVQKVNKSQLEIQQKRSIDQTLMGKGTKAAGQELLDIEHTLVFMTEKQGEQVVLKPFTKVTETKEASEKNHKILDTEVPDQLPKAEDTKSLKDPQDVKKKSACKKETSLEKKGTTLPDPRACLSREKDMIAEKDSNVEFQKTETDTFGIKEIFSLMSTKPVEQLEIVELETLISSTFDKYDPEDLEHVSTEERLEPKKVKGLSKPISPKSSSLNKVHMKPPEKEDLVPQRIPLAKEISPKVVQISRVSTQPEEEVDKIVAEEKDCETEEMWGWDLVPAEDWEGEREDGVLQAPGMPGPKRGELGIW